MSTTALHHGIYGIILNNDQILLVLKSRGPYTGMWDLPGGAPLKNQAVSGQLDGGSRSESEAQTLYREIYEETGIRVLTAHCLSKLAVTLKLESGLFHHTGVLYSIDTYETSDANMSVEKEDVHRAQWFKLSSMSKIKLSPFAQQAVELVLKKKKD